MALACQLSGLRRAGNCERLVEREDEPGADGELLLNVALEPPDGSRANANGSPDTSADSAADDRAGDSGARGGETHTGKCGLGMVGADDGAFGVHAGVSEVVEINELGVNAIGLSVGEGYGVGLKADGRA